MTTLGEALHLVALGLARYKAKDIDGAIEAYRLAAAANPQCQEAQERLLYAREEREDILSEVGNARERLASRPGGGGRRGLDAQLGERGVDGQTFC